MMACTWLIAFVCLNVYSTGALQTYHVAFLGDTPSSGGDLGRLMFTNGVTKPNVDLATEVVSDIRCQPTLSASASLSSTTVINLPASCDVLIPASTGLYENAALKVTVADDDTLLHVLQKRGADYSEGYLAIADQYLGLEYFVATYCSTGGNCQFAITPVEDDTSIMIRFPNDVDTDATCIPGVYTSSVTAGTAVPFNLNELDVLYFESTADLSGTRITSNKKIAVFVGAINIPAKDSSTHTRLIEQIPPVNKWGKEFVVVPNSINEAGDLIKIVSQIGHTKVYISGFSPFFIETAGGSVERRIDKEMNSYISSSYPVLIVQVMGVSLYNDSDDVSNKPAMVLVQSVQHWTSSTTYLPCEILPNPLYSLASVAAENSIALATGTPIQVEPIGGSSYQAGYAYLLTSLLTTISGDGEFGAYGVCNSNAAYLLHADWTTDSWSCVPTIPYPGDDVDNNCNGLIDEDVCTDEDIRFTFTASQNASGVNTVRSLGIQGATRIPFSVKICNSIASIYLETDDYPAEYTSIQITNNTLSVLCSNCDMSVDENIQFTDCDMAYELVLVIKHDLVAKTTLHTIMSDPAALIPTGATWTSNAINIYTDMFLTSYVDNTTFVIELLQKDCGKIYSDSADQFGTKFLAPVSDSMTDFHMFITAISTDVQVTFSQTVSLSPLTVPMETTVTISKSQVTTASYDSVLIESMGGEISVYVIQMDSGKSTGYKLLPLDILGPAYHTFIDSSLLSTGGCDVFSLDVDNEIASTLLQPYTKHPILYADLNDMHFVEADKPVAVFCGTRDDTWAQMPPRETLGKHFYIPEITEPIVGAELKLNLIATEDSTVNIIKGDFDNMDTFELTGATFTRDYVINTSRWEITSTKAIQLHLEVRIPGNNVGYAIVIPPTSQYSTKHVFPAFNQSVLNSYGVDKNGDTTVRADLPAGNSVFIKTHTVPTFSLTFFDGGNLIIPSDTMSDDGNEICTVRIGTPADGVDNDCDGLIDEETCASTTDDDIDGTRFEDCSDRSAPSNDLEINVVSNIVACDATTTPGSTPSATNTGTTLFSSTLPPNPTTDVPVTPPSSSTDSPPTFTPIVVTTGTVLTFGSTTSSSGNGDNTTAEETCLAPCECPCGWTMAKNYTTEELQQVVEEIQEKLKISKSELSATMRKKTSAPDHRATSIAVGYVGVVFIVVYFGTIVILDVTSIINDVKMLLDNVRQAFNP